MATHLEFTKERFLCANETKMEFFTLKDNLSNWNSAGAAQRSAFAGQAELHGGLSVTRIGAAPSRKQQNRRKTNHLCKRHRASHNQDNGPPLEQIPKCPPVARPKPEPEAM